MKTKDKIITFILCLIVVFIYFVVNSYNYIDKKAMHLYNVYLDGKKIGAITDKESLYSLIDEKQQVIKDKYNVRNVYPPNGLEIVETYSYNEDISDIETIYNKIEELQDFTILGYQIKVSATEDHESYVINVLDKEIFNIAVEDFILAFIEKDDYTSFIDGTQKELEDIGINYTNMDIIEDITIKETYISINDKIYQDSNELTQHLLFGFNHKEQSYTVKAGDSIESIAEDFELNPQEILIANSRYASKDSLLTVGDKIMIAYVIPELSFAYTVNEIEEVEEEYNKETKRDNSLPSSYSEITTPGVTGISRIYSEYKVVNGKLASDVEIIDKVTIREKVDQVTLKGKKSVSWGWEIFEDTGSGWTWPTVDRYVVTSEYGFRELGGGKQHNGIDISGTPWMSNIYAANDGVVTYIYSGCPNDGYYGSPCGGGYGNQVVIDHGNNIYTLYAHIGNSVPVKIGQTVNKGQIIGYMADSGSSTGTHLHFAVSTGNPRGGGIFYNPRRLYK